MKMKKTHMFLVLALCALAGVLALVVPSGKSSSSTWPFSTVTSGQLSKGGITLSSPVAPLPATAVSSTAADAAVDAYFGGIPILDTGYQHCVDATASPEINQDCYAVTVDPSKLQLPGQGNASPKPLTWLIVLVDPTGQVIESAGGSN
jgi:hypothetical protein